MDKYNQIFVQTHRIYNIKSGPQLWALGGYDGQCRSIECSKRTFCWDVEGVEAGENGKALQFPLNFALSLKLL